MTEGPAIRDNTVFTEAFVPSAFTNREQEISNLRNCLGPLIQRKAVKNAWLHGQPGTGKTSIAKSLLNEFEDRHGLRGAYVNCWETCTFHSVLDKLVRDFRILGAERLSTLFKMERLEKHLQDRPCVLILDEIDKPSAKERDSLIYSFCGLPNVALICICNSRHFYYTLDSRVRSRLDVVLIEFKPYTDEQIQEILRQRAELGLMGEQTEEDIFQKIGQLANGDARVAIQTLRHAVSAADGSRSAQILAHHLKTAHRSAGDAKKKYLLAGLGDHSNIIYQIVRDCGEIESGPLWQEYLNYCRKAKFQAAAPRTFSLYLKRLAELDLIAYRRALGVKGNIRIFEVR